MLRSMTGFASKSVTVTSNSSKTTITINLKSLNSRFFESTFKLPYQLSSLELDLINLLKSQLHRGHIYLTLYANNQDMFKGTVEPSLPTVEGYLHAIDKIKLKYSLEGNLTVSDLLRLPDLFTVEEKSIDEATKKAIVETTNALIKDLIAAQTKEGAALKHDIEQRISIMEKEIDMIATASATLMEQQKEKIKKTLQEVSPNEHNAIDIQKHAAYVLLEKMDINEEIVRFKSHLKNLTATLNSEDIEKGKRLDFTLQEMAREINTIAAKCSDATISSIAINIT